MNGPESASSRDPLDRLAESFLERFRRGERPSLGEYIAAHPELADDIRELFPALVEVEQLKSAEHRPPVVEPPGRPEFSRLGDYQILGVIGQGGMGVVYEAVRESLRSRVALKVMDPRYRGRAGYLRRFHNEARSAARLHHTNIVSVFDYGEHDGVCYYAMQYIAGHGLDEILVDVRRLRANQGPVQAAPVEGGPATNSTGEPASNHADRGAAGTDPLLRAVTHGLMTGQFAAGAGVTVDRDATSPPPTEPIASGAGGPTAATRDLAFEVVRSLAQPSLPARDQDRNAPESAPSLSSSSLAGQAEDRYHREVARLGAQVADALAHAHKRGVLHRDIKPSNLLLDAVGNVWVTDFGLAKFEEGEDLSRSQDVVGTLRYMAPERFRGVSDRRCDLYALGATLYELLTLRPAFASLDRLRLIDQIVNEPPAPPRQLDRRIPRDLETIVLKALAKDPKDRFATGDELGAELRRFLEYRPIRSRPIPTYERIWRWCRRNRAVAALLALATTLMISLAIGSTVSAWRFREQNHELRFEQSRTKASLARAERAEHEGRLALGQSLISEGAALRRSGLMGQRFDSLDRLARAARILSADPEGRKRLPEIRNEAIGALGLTDLREHRRHDCGDVFGFTVDAALERYAVVERSGAAVVRRLDDDRELVRLPGPDRRDYWWAWSSFSPDGELLVAAYELTGDRGVRLRIWHLGRRELLGNLMNRARMAFHPDGRLLFGAPEGGIGLWDRRERRVIRRLPLDFASNYLALDPEGRRLAVNNADAEKPRLVILELETSRVLADWRLQVGTGELAWSADGQLLAVCGGANVYVWNVRRGVLASILQGHTNGVVVARFAQSGYLLATTSWDGTTRLWDAVSGESLAVAPGNGLGSFSPDDRRMAFRDGVKVGVWDLAVGTECRTLHPGMVGNRTERRDDTGGVSWADVSPDGRLVATCWHGVRLWEADTGRELAHLLAGQCETVLFHPDGQSLISFSLWGLYRWPIRPDPEQGRDAIRVGPPELLRETAEGGWYRAAWLPDHRTLALLDNANARVLLVDSSHPHPAWSRATSLDSGPNRRMTSVAVSPDGRWLAVGGWKEAGVRVWDLQRRRLERLLRPKDAVGETSFFIGFSQDSHWLISSTVSEDETARAYHFWCVGTWEPGRRIVQERSATAWNRPAFTRDGRLMALGIAPDQVLLADATSGRELARLTTSQPVTPAPMVFSPDGTKLVAGTNQNTALVWDLRRIREQLAPMGLDWDAPPYPVASAASEETGPVPPPRPVRVEGAVIEPRARR